MSNSDLYRRWVEEAWSQARVDGGAFAEIWHLEDTIGLLGHLGVLPAP